MEPRAKTTAAQGSRLLYFALGAVFCVASGFLAARGMDAVRWITGKPLTFDARPYWLKYVKHLVVWLPWIAVVLLSVARLAGVRRVRPIAFAEGVALVYVGAIAYLFAMPFLDNWRYRSEFEPKAWRENAEAQAMWPMRLRMIDDLLARHDLRGKTRDEIESLLGPGDRNPYWSDLDIVYVLGPERGFVRIDSEWLGLRFENGRVVDHEIVRD